LHIKECWHVFIVVWGLLDCVGLASVSLDGFCSLLGGYEALDLGWLFPALLPDLLLVC
jgi:hypothetical protein